MKRAPSRFLTLVICVVLAAAPAAAGSLADFQAGPAGVEWRPALAAAGLTLTISGPEGFYLRQQFEPGASPSFSVFDGAGNLRPSGAYVWELRAVFKLDEGTRRELEGARLSGDESTLLKGGKLPKGPTYQSGSFSILDGAIVAGGREEPARPGGGPVLATKVVHTEGVCAGFDCPASPAFGDSTILMMENNTRIKFGDTSASPFPNNDWEIEANSATSGALSYLGFNDCGTADNDGGCATDLVFAVEAGARSSALYVEGDGDVGIGTSNPVLDLHIVTGNTPALRLEQDGSSGFTPRVWDVAGNETNFFVRDVTGGSGLPFRIFPGAGSSALVIDGEGEVGVGTSSPDADLNVVQTNATAGFLLERAGDPVTMLFSDTSAGQSWEFKINAGGGFAVNDPASSGGELILTSDGDLTIEGDYFSATCTAPGSPCAPDYVFAPEYELMPLEELRAFVAQNRHLPNVPSEADLRKAGQINLSKFQLTLLEKVEELALYTLQQDDRITGLTEELRARNQELAELKALVESLGRD